MKGLTGKLVGDRGDISQNLFEALLEQPRQVITQLRKTMRNQLLPLADNLLLHKRALIETSKDQLKNISSIELFLSRCKK